MTNTVYGKLCPLEDAQKKCARHGAKGAELVPVLLPREAIHTGHPYRVREWGVYVEDKLVATIGVRRDGRLRWNYYGLDRVTKETQGEGTHE